MGFIVLEHGAALVPVVQGFCTPAEGVPTFSVDAAALTTLENRE
jgi:hypothetical protein